LLSSSFSISDIDAMPKNTIVYIAGYGRSGSTLLARILGSHENIFTAGELINFYDLVDSEDSVCSCGQKIQQCPFWSGIIQKFKNDFGHISELADIQKSFESISRVFGHILERDAGKRISYRDATSNLIDHIFRNLPENVRYIIDSSKTTWSRSLRPLALSGIGTQPVKVIHIVRDGRGCMWSMMKGTDTGLLKGTNLNRHSSFPVFRTAVHWPFANLAAHVFQAMHSSENYCRIRYEDLVENPVKTCAVLGEFLGVRFDKQIEILEKSGEIHPGHLIAGNRMRSFTKIKIKPDVDWKKRLKFRHKLFFLFLNWPMMLFYKYR